MFPNASFPHLLPATYQIMSPPTSQYNCIAWAAEDDTRWWWPTVPHHWPAGVPMDVTVAAFVQAFGMPGYLPCADELLEAGYLKVAFYAIGPTVTHAARQLSSWRWTSKVGYDGDIDHGTPDVICGPASGAVVPFLRRGVGSVP